MDDPNYELLTEKLRELYPEFYVVPLSRDGKGIGLWEARSGKVCPYSYCEGKTYGEAITRFAKSKLTPEVATVLIKNAELKQELAILLYKHEQLEKEVALYRDCLEMVIRHCGERQEELAQLGAKQEQVSRRLAYDRGSQLQHDVAIELLEILNAPLQVSEQEKKAQAG